MIVLFNPRSTTPGKQPLPLSVMSLSAVLEGREPWHLVDGNIESDPYASIAAHLGGSARSGLALLGVTVMPGPQLTQAVLVCRRVRRELPHVRIVWGGYFPTQHTDTVLGADYVDYVVRSQGENPMLALVAALRQGATLDDVPSLSWRRNGTIAHNPSGPMVALDDLPDLPYNRVPMQHYLHRTYLGARTAAHHSSFGCPFACNFCAVGAMSGRRWLAQSPARIEQAVRQLVDGYRVDAIQMHDMDFFISEARAAECAERLVPLRINWWALGRIDTLMQYSDRTWQALKASGLKMVFSGAETASEAMLKRMDKGGNASPALALALAARLRALEIVPEFSFVIGTPPNPLADLVQTFEFIRRLKVVNPNVEIILYTYTPVPMKGALYEDASRVGFAFPSTLDEWASDRWRQTSLRRGDGLPWMHRAITKRVRNFERVLNAFYPTSTDLRLTGANRMLLKILGGWRYALRLYAAPYELRVMQRLIQYQRPETTGF